MKNQTLTQILLNNELTNQHYGGVVSCDNLPIHPASGNKYYIVNTEINNSGVVGHWIVLFFKLGACDFFLSFS